MNNVQIEVNRDLMEQIVDTLDQRLLEVGMFVENKAKENCTSMKAVDTGTLRASITSKADNNKVSIGTNVEYGVYVHEGTSKMDARPFLRNAVFEHIPEILNIIKADWR